MCTQPAVSPDGNFIQRPTLGACFRAPAGETVVVAIWSHGVVFEGGQACSATSLLIDYQPTRNQAPVRDAKTEISNLLKQEPNNETI